MAAEVALNIPHHSLSPFNPQRPKPLVQQLELLAKTLTLDPVANGKVAASATRDEVRGYPERSPHRLPLDIKR